jgi:NitT/TauT family transport system substrate-binding protein
MKKFRFARLATLLATAFAFGPSFAADKVTLAHSGTLSEAFYSIAATKGYYKDEDLDVTHVYFDSAAKEIPLLATGELDAGSGPVSAGLFNAEALGFKIKVVANRLAAHPADRSLLLMIRKDLIDGKNVKRYADLRGMRIALVAKGIGTASMLNEAMKKVGLSFKDAKTVYLPFPLQATAFRNRAIDGAFSAEPFVTDLVESGEAVPFGTWGEIYPDFQVGLMLFGEKFVKERPNVAVRLLKSLLRASRDFRDVVDRGHFRPGPKADAIAKIIAEGMNLKEERLRALTLPEIDLDRPVNIETLQNDLEFFKAEGDVRHAALRAEHLVDLSSFQAAINSLARSDAK